MGYNKIQMYGNADINYLVAYDGAISDDDITSIASKSVHTPAWRGDMFLRATFGTNISASDFGSGEYIIGYNIQRECTSSNNILEPTASLEVSQADARVVYDYNVSNGKSYRYWIFPVFKNESGDSVFGAPVITDAMTAQLSGWSIIGLKSGTNKNEYVVDENNIWNFYLNIEPGSFEPQFGKTIHDGFGIYPKVTNTNKNYLKLSLSTLFGDLDCCSKSGSEYINDNIDKLTAWQNFCANSCLKLIRTPKGHILIGDIESTSYDCDETMLETPTTVSFNFTETKSPKGLSIYGLEE